MMRTPRPRGPLIVTLAFVVGCQGGSDRFTDPAAAAGSGAPRLVGALVGVWRRTIAAVGDGGATFSNETTWRFRGDGTASRTIISRNVSTGATDEFTANVHWLSEGSTLVITFDPPDAGELRLSFHIDKDKLTLGTLVYTRVSS